QLKLVSAYRAPDHRPRTGCRRLEGVAARGLARSLDDLDGGGGVVVFGRLRVAARAVQHEVGEEVCELDNCAVGELRRAVAREVDLLSLRAGLVGRDPERDRARLAVGDEARLEEAVAA